MRIASIVFVLTSICFPMAEELRAQPAVRGDFEKLPVKVRLEYRGGFVGGMTPVSDAAALFLDDTLNTALQTAVGPVLGTPLDALFLEPDTSLKTAAYEQFFKENLAAAFAPLDPLYRMRSLNSLEDVLTFNGDGSSVKGDMGTLNLELPVILKELDTLLYLSFSARNTTLVFNRAPFPAGEDQRTYHLEDYYIDAGFYRDLSSRWYYFISFSANLGRETGADSGDGFFGEATAGVNYSAAESLQFGFGITSSRSFGEALVFPYFTFYWNFDEDHEVELILPTKLEYRYWLNFRSHVGFGGEWDGGLNVLRGPDQQIVWNRGDAYLVFEYAFSELFKIRFKGGYNVYGQYDYYRDGIPYHSHSGGEGPFASVGLHFEF